MGSLKEAKRIRGLWNVINKNWKGCVYKELQEEATVLRNRIIGIAMMKNYKTKEDEEAVRILDDVLK